MHGTLLCLQTAHSSCCFTSHKLTMTGAFKAPGRAVGLRQYLMRPATDAAPLGPCDSRPCWVGGKSVDRQEASCRSQLLWVGCQPDGRYEKVEHVLTSPVTPCHQPLSRTLLPAAAHLWLDHNRHVLVLVRHIQPWQLLLEHSLVMRLPRRAQTPHQRHNLHPVTLLDCGVCPAHSPVHQHLATPHSLLQSCVCA